LTRKKPLSTGLRKKEFISHKPGLGTPDEMGSKNHEADGSEEGIRGLGWAEIGAQKMPQRSSQGGLALPKPGYVAIATF
jgi:hypothetical protein